ncbi:IPExxxVDY family protein [Flavobacterium sp.]|jgi:hypothetical protein|uniref:IPExxxVDY family protein n=1 Tax=Flavobacterium sp. TaxID=239 RepID=UPI002A834C80|nr:IPExxxVDY family protein [Flavobacterium sp.]
MAIHKIQIVDFLSIDYELIAIHTSIEDYRLAYFLNKELNIQLCKNNLNIAIETHEGKSAFNHYFFDDKKTDIQWSLIENKTSINSTNKKSVGIFENMEVNVYLLPEYKKADFLLKIENVDSFFKIEEVTKKIESISQVSMSYLLDIDNLKSKNNLIF